MEVINTEIIKGDRVRVIVNRNGFHLRSFNGTCLGWAKTGLCKVKEDGCKHARNYSSENVKKIR